MLDGKTSMFYIVSTGLIQTLAITCVMLNIKEQPATKHTTRRTKIGLGVHSFARAAIQHPNIFMLRLFDWYSFNRTTKRSRRVINRAKLFLFSVSFCLCSCFAFVHTVCVRVRGALAILLLLRRIQSACASVGSFTNTRSEYFASICLMCVVLIANPIQPNAMVYGRLARTLTEPLPSLCNAFDHILNGKNVAFCIILRCLEIQTVFFSFLCPSCNMRDRLSIESDLDSARIFIAAYERSTFHHFESEVI